MNYNAIRHDPITGCYAYDVNTLVIKLETGKEITNVYLCANDPCLFDFGTEWKGERIVMKRKAELRHSIVWESEFTPKYKRLMYYFVIECGDEHLYFLEDGLHDNVKCGKGQILQYFRYSWLNPADVCVTPKWAEDIIWYQIFPDRFCRARGTRDGKPEILKWGDESKAKYYSFYGGNIRGITEKLDYIKDLGVGGLYLTPIMLSDTNHRYNVHDYTLVDPDIGEQSDLKALIDGAHEKGLKVMLDAVFNHCGTKFFAWRDVVENGKKSKYYDWFFINSDDFDKGNQSTADGRYFSFAFAAYMPKLNTNNPEVMDYLIGVCKSWVALGVDGIRFDVGNEISHAFLKKLRLSLKAIKPDLYLLGEIWHRSLQWLMGDEYDSIMNFQFLNAVNDYQTDKRLTARDLMYALNENYNNYYRQVNNVLFNMLDNHDVDRVITRVGSVDAMLQELVILMTMQGSPCIYYGTETALAGEVAESHNRRCMPWQGIADGMFDDIIAEFKKIVALRAVFLRFKNCDIEWKFTDNARMVNYVWKSPDGKKLEVLLNTSDTPTTVSIDAPVYSRKLEGDKLLAGGIAVLCE